MSKFNLDTKSLALAFEKFGIAMDEVVTALLELFTPLKDVIEEIRKSIFGINEGWEQYPFESDKEYAARLVEDGWLDNPDARWEYQKIVLSTPIRVLRRRLER